MSSNGDTKTTKEWEKYGVCELNRQGFTRRIPVQLKTMIVEVVCNWRPKGKVMNAHVIIQVTWKPISHR